MTSTGIRPPVARHHPETRALRAHPRLHAPAPGWSIDADVVVVGSGVAGLTAALRCEAAGLRTVVVTKARLDDGSTRWAQGGIAAALGEGDTPNSTWTTPWWPARACATRRPYASSSPRAPTPYGGSSRPGAHFDESSEGGLELAREGGHHRRRIAHAGGDATGAEVSRALVEAVHARGLRTIENALVLDLLTDAEGRTAGVSLHVMGEGQHDGVGAVHAPAVVLATGGMGQVFSATTNPSVSTGDGVALALRAGAEVSDLEFVQFHPTVLFLGADAEGQQPPRLRGGARRGRPPDRRRRRALHGGPARTRRTGAPGHRRQGHHTADAGAGRRAHVPRRPALRRGHVGAPLPDDPRRLPQPRHRPGHRARPGRPGRPLRLRRRPHRLPGPYDRPRPVRVRGGRLHRCARREPARLELAPRRPRLRRADRRRHHREPGRKRPPRACARAGPAPREA